MANLQIVPAYSNVEAQYVEMMVPLYSYGCEKKVKKALANLKGIYSVTVDYKLQKVTVWGICNKYDVLATIKSKRKEARFWDCDDKTDEPCCAIIPQSVESVIPTKGRMSLSWKAWKKKVIKYYQG
ncbi:PREDICTED: uncharacterized protein LOC104585778 [Nelumbo nucifera]|uniref:Uncharacterized protein LOC104585778 n=2 Tax=Nelumbo nucifera TaxID=4432 RepID=A0A1U7YTL5_NELNU|nr:PREDICTED: uncharacterized protein LOC104585778 [Nelumbo nucifera]DAD18078.1 TPA_asm: hypothetical protein HUJ06_019541 [Nelumbo nucifera]